MMTLTERLFERIDDDQHQDVLPNDILREVEENEPIDPEEIDLSVSTSELYPRWTRLRAFVTTLAIAAILWPASLVAMGHISTTQLLTGNIPLGDLLTFTVYGYFAVAIGVGTGVSGALWYVLRAPPETKEHLDAGPAGAFITITITASLMLLFTAVLGWLLFFGAALGAIVGLLAILVVALIAILMLIAGLFSLDLETFAIGGVLLLIAVLASYGVEVLDNIWPAGIPVDYYILMATYIIAVGISSVLPQMAISGVLPPMYISGDLDSYREQLGEERVARNIIEEETCQLQKEAPEGYDVDVPLPDFDSSKNSGSAELTITETFDLVDAYKHHLDVWTDLQTDGRSDTDTLLMTAATVTHPQRCASPKVAMSAADVFADLADVCERIKNKRFDDYELEDPQVEQALDDIEATSTTDAGDVQRLKDGCEVLEDWQSDIEEREQFENRVEELRTGLASTFDNPPSVDFKNGELNDEELNRLKQQEQVLSLAEEVTHLQREYHSDGVPKVLLDVLRDNAFDARDVEPYELLIETAEQALDANNQHGMPFDRAQSHVLEIARGDPTKRYDELENLKEVLERGTRIATFLGKVDNEHPSVEAAEWQDALETSVDNLFPNVLRPIDSQIEAMKDGMWERSDLYTYDWEEFESLVGSLYADEGYDTEVTQDTNDEGVDVWARSPTETVAIQVKQNSQGNSVGRRVLQQLASAIAKGSADRVVVVTSAEFTNTAIDYAAEFGTNMNLIDGDELVRRLSVSDLPPPRNREN